MGNLEAGRGRADRPRIDFAGLAQQLLQRAEYWVAQWMPGGKRAGHEWQGARSKDGGPGDSLSVNLNNGRWGHFSAAGASGGDLVSLYAYLFTSGDNFTAACELLVMLGEPDPREAHVPRAPVTQRDVAATVQRPEPTGWRPVVPVPPWAPNPTFSHFSRRPEDIELIAEYRLDDRLYGYVVRFRTSEGGKDPLPHTWCVDHGDGAGTQRWHWKTWEEPRPLFVPSHTFNPARVVLVVEGEKCAVVGHEWLGNEYDVVCWPGGGKAWNKADWSWLAGRTVVLWPDCDAHRQKLNKVEAGAGVDPLSKPLLAESEQPGVQAMRGIAGRLVRDHGCTVAICTLPAPGAVKNGWDIADAVAEGWDAERLRAFVRAAIPVVPEGAAAETVAGAGRRLGGERAVPKQTVTSWASRLLCGKYGPLAVRENVVLAMDGVPEERVPGIEAAGGLIAFNEFSNNIIKTGETPWDTPAGGWLEEDELLMGDWLARHHELPSMARGTLEEAVRMVAFRHRYHPVRQYLESLATRWDQTDRLRTWLRVTCLAEDEWDDNDPLQRYLSKVGTWTIMAMCARVMTPGCKFDYMLILEGPQGLGKSTLVHMLGGEFAADTPLDLGNKDSFQNLQGIWVYEMGELDSLSRAEITKTKQFISSTTDRFRATFDRRPKDYPRQCIFIGTTNEEHYLTDPTGNRRFWPVRVTRQIDNEWLRVNREQLLAEAMHRLAAGERFYPTPEESVELFEPQQQQRAVENAIESAIGRFLYDEDQQVIVGKQKGTQVQEIALVELLSRIGIGIEKLGPGRYHEKQAAAALRKLGWKEGRSSAPGRPRVYRRPAQPGIKANRPDAGQQPEGGDEACPF